MRKVMQRVVVLERVARYSHAGHVVMVVASRIDRHSPWTAAFMVSAMRSHTLPILRETCEAYETCQDAVDDAWLCARSLIDADAPRLM